MKIVFVCDTMGSGGAERVIANLSNEFSSRGYLVTILMLSEKSENPFYALKTNVSVQKLSDKKLRYFKKAKVLKKAIISLSPDIVISFLSYVCVYTWWALKNTDIPYITSERNDPNKRGFLRQFLLNKSFKKAAGCVFQTDDALRWYGKIAQNKSAVIYNPVNIEIPSKVVTNRKNQILFVGRLTDQKNVFMLIDAFESFDLIHPGYSLKIYGDGPLKTEISKYIDKKGLSNKISIKNNSPEWHKLESDSSLFVLPSKYEGMPNVLAEALCLGIPSVSTNCPIGGPKELKKIFPTRLVLSSDDSALSFADAMEFGIRIKDTNPQIPDELKNNNIADKWIDFINKCMRGNKNV